MCCIYSTSYFNIVLAKLVPISTYPYHLGYADDKPYVPTYQVTKERAKSLGIDFIPLKESIAETVESLKEKTFSVLVFSCN
uniref:Cinnamoyl-CoA reductase 1-like n=1 Tax=Nelumbo nucifera TaxID=4432 RepID=A0A822YJY8_NELNU|nr:TPA_asm: hypothetical protein HUJ06_031136 [Nelumbo nucifera]DAD29678.1 TPA_asm: hypothetical protein HUJ06_031146 [Nelumbo nucifera]